MTTLEATATPGRTVTSGVPSERARLAARRVYSLALNASIACTSSSCSALSGSREGSPADAYSATAPGARSASTAPASARGLDAARLAQACEEPAPAAARQRRRGQQLLLGAALPALMRGARR